MLSTHLAATECLWEDAAAHPCVIVGLCSSNSSSTSNPTTSLLSATSSARHATQAARQRVVSCSRDGLLREHALEYSIHRSTQRAAVTTLASAYSPTRSVTVTVTVTAKLVPLLAVPTGSAACCMCVLDWPCNSSSSGSSSNSGTGSVHSSAVAVVGCANGYWQAWSVTEQSDTPLTQQQPLWSQRVHDAAVMSIAVLPQHCWQSDTGTCMTATKVDALHQPSTSNVVYKSLAVAVLGSS
jgi:hypothetical protein